MDLGLPDMDGIAVTQIIRNMEEPTNKILIIALTAHFNNEIKESCRQAGMDDFIEKPIGHKTTQKSWRNI
ncbi:MAG: response regulator [Coxiellaceae bacterium]|nr:MAG: response regulator [Coxiellaceae bacterium]